MNVKKLGLTVLALTSLSASAANDVYGTVSELITRSGDNSDNAIYFRMNVMTDYATFESCVVDGTSLVWYVDLNNPVTSYQYDLLLKSYTQKLPIRLTGQNNVCENGNTDSDKIFELSPWSWDVILNPEVDDA